MRSIRKIIKKILLNLFVYGIRNRTLNLFIRKQYTVMFHIGRCGSTVLADMLNQHPEIHWGKEVFQPYHKHKKPGFITRGRYIRQLIRRFGSMAVSGTFGFETKYLPLQDLSYQCTNISIGEYIKLLRKMGFTRFIVLQRKNYLRRAVSFEVSRVSGDWHTSVPTFSPTKITLNVNSFPFDTGIENLVESFKAIDNSFQQLAGTISREEVLHLTYEADILKDPTIGYEKVCRFLGIQPQKPRIYYKRTNPFKLEELLENFNEVRAKLENTEYAWMLKNNADE